MHARGLNEQKLALFILDIVAFFAALNAAIYLRYEASLPFAKGGSAPWQQIFIAFPVVAGLVMASLQSIDPGIRLQARGLGASPFQVAFLLLREGRFSNVAAVMAAFGAVISEVGASMMVGGNIAGRTRTLTTAISLEVGKGETALSIALGIILLTLALLISAVVHWAGQRKT